MCGITGIYAFNEIGRFHMINLQKSIDLLDHRGPDTQGSFLSERVGLGHRRLSVIDLTAQARQPMSDPSGRYHIVYNGEIFNFREIREGLEKSGMHFKTRSDTEVLLQTFIRNGKDCLNHLNGFFAFAIFDQQENELFLARDRYGIKPLYYFSDEDKFFFASEIRSILSYGIEKSLNTEALYFYLQLNYIPAPLTIINGVYKLLPGHSISVKNKQVETSRWYEFPEAGQVGNVPYDHYKKNIRELLERSVERRMIADVPVGAFLSGGIDSSIITGLASSLTDKLNTFSIGFPDEPFFNETRYSRIVADHFKTNHTEFNLSNNDLFGHLHSMLDHIDEPFADSSALPVYILSRETKKSVTVALSGDGADELFAGYNKHKAFYRALHPGLTEYMVHALHVLWKILPGSRNDPFSNYIRQLRRFAAGYHLSPEDRYWFWCSLNNEKHAGMLLTPGIREKVDMAILSEQKKKWLQGSGKDMESVLKTDLLFMLPNDMLYKVDLMSMAYGLEVRVPFLDHELVEYVANIPENFRIDKNRHKVLLTETFSDILPEKIINRTKKGFEVPLLRWMRTDLRSTIENQLLDENFIKEQGIFNAGEINKYKKRLFSRSPGDIHAHIWGLIVFQWWWKKYFRS